MWQWAWALVKRWFITMFLILMIAAFGRNVGNAYTGGDYQVDTGDYTSHILDAVEAPFQFFSAGNSAGLSEIFAHIPTSLFFVITAFVGSFVFGIAKGLGDVFWGRNPLYKVFQGAAWVMDAIPLFGLVCLLELGSLYASMYWTHGPFQSMIPNETFWAGDFLRVILLMWAPMVYVSRIVAISVNSQLGEMYLLTARGKGLKARNVLLRHIFPNTIPKLQNELFTVFIMVLSSLLALEYLSFQTHGSMFDLMVNMGNGTLGQAGLYLDPGPFQISMVADYLVLMAVVITLFQLATALLKHRWEVSHHA